ncbi:hypothetical protein [Adhaeribacter soli]|uniref:Uncharacterized protein n=1 Tax=Adhaeribacter soli TaxID=2607655 RepID=A0A5N1IXE3_9BACT|nr:hypothetical protein [Adhaeribacter soli]KAA9338954.1 hypothetical protein F0P94_09190 [Adhaeribacter soli]
MDAPFSLSLELSDHASYNELYDRIEKPLLFLKDANVASKNFNDWRKAGLWFDDASEKRTWTKLNLEQYIWLKMIQQLRQLGCSTDLIQKVKQQLIVPLGVEELFNTYKEELLKKTRKMPLRPEEKAELLNSFENEEFIQSLKETEEGQRAIKSLTKIRSILLNALVLHQHVAVLIFPDGTVVEWLDEILQIDPNAGQLLKRTHLYLSITEHLMEFLIDPDKESFISPLQLLTEEERQVLSALRDKTLKEVLITYTKDPKTKKETKHLITTKDGEMPADDEQKILDILLNKKYHGFELKRRNGNRFYFERQTHREL